MKTLFLTLLLASFAFASIAGTKEDSLRIAALEHELSNQKAEMKEEFRYQLDKLEKERDMYMNDYRDNRNSLYLVVGLMATIISITLAFVQFTQSKRIKTNLDKNEERIQNELGKSEEKIHTELSKIAEANKVYLKSMIDQRAIEVELMSQYPIRIYAEDTGKASELRQLLSGYQFKTVSVNSVRDFSVDTLSENDVVVFYDHTEQKDIKPEESTWLESLLQKENFKNLPQETAILYYNEHSLRHSLSKQFRCVASANSFSSVYNNLMSMLHYKRYLNTQSNS